MSALLVDPAGLSDVAAAWRRVASGLEDAPAAVRAAGARLGDDRLLAVSGQMRAAADRVGALARVVGLVADDFARTEAGVTASFASSFVDYRAMGSLLAGMSPDALAALLAASPGLARLVVDDAGPLTPGSAAARLSAVLGSGGSPTVVLRQGLALLAGLPEPERLMLALLHPALVTGLASAPLADRFAATRVLVSAEVGRLREQLGRARGADAARLTRRLRVCTTLLAGRHQLIAFDPRGDGRVAEVFGDPVTARHVAVYVPGTGTSLERYAGNAERASSFAAAAPDLAVVLWQNADFPDQPGDEPLSLRQLVSDPLPDSPIGLGESVLGRLRDHDLAAAYRDAAGPAGAALAHDVEGLRMVAPAGSDLTVLGHSYGGSIVGSAEAHGLVADRIVHIASAGAYVSDVHDYAAGECGTRRFSMTAPDDPIQFAQGVGFGAGSPVPLGHGIDPDALPSVTRLDTGLRADGQSLVSGHGGMFEPESGGWRNLLAVMRGEPVQVLEPQRWSHHVVVAGPSGRPEVPHFVVTRSPYDAPGYVPPSQPSTGPVCVEPGSW